MRETLKGNTGHQTNNFHQRMHDRNKTQSSIVFGNVVRVNGKASIFFKLSEDELY